VVEGHTDSQGKAAVNHELSATAPRRSATTWSRDYLVERGVPADRITAEGHGADQPVAENSTAEGRANNRRVEIVVKVAAAAGPRVVLQWLTDGDAVVRHGRRVFVVAVPRWSVVTVRAAAPSTRPKLWHGFVTYHQTVWDSPPAASCLRLSVELDADTTLLLDGQVLTRGQRIAHRTVGVHAGAHTLVAVRCAGDIGGTCVTRFRETLPPIAASASENLCQDVALDLHQRRSVAILQARAAPGCDAALAWHAGELAAAHLRSTAADTGRTFSDLASFASIAQALGVLRDGLNPSTGAAVGAATGSDSLDIVASVAKEAWRQGIDELVTLELRCTGPDLSLQATKISVREALDRPLGPVAGLDLKNLMRVESIAFAGEAQLPTTVASVVDRLFDRNYLRFREGPTQFLYRKPARIDALGSPGAADDAITADYTHPVSSRERCRFQQYAAARRGALQEPESRVRIPIDRASADGGPASSVPYSLTFRARRPGTYLVSASTKDAVADVRCVEFIVPPREVWGSVVAAPDIFLRTPMSRVAARHLRFTLGHTWYRWRPWFGLGAVASYTYTHYAGPDGVPAWQDLGVDPAETHRSLQWSRHAVVVGPLVEFRSRDARIPVEFRGRLSVSAGMAIVNVADLVAFPDFAGSSRWGTTDLRLRPTLDATVELGVSAFAGPLAISPLVALGATALNDMSSGKWAISATGGAGFYTGFGILLGGAP
jgi:hypothetical protein